MHSPKSLKLYDQLSDGLIFNDDAYCVYTFFENDNFKDAYRKINFHNIQYYIPVTTNLFGIDVYHDKSDFGGMNSVYSVQDDKPEVVSNISNSFVYDIDSYFDLALKTLPMNSQKILDAFSTLTAYHPTGLQTQIKKTFIYFINTSTKFDDNVENRRLSILINNFKRYKKFPFVYGLIGIIKGNEIKYIKFYDKRAKDIPSETTLKVLNKLTGNLQYGKSFSEMSTENLADDFLKIAESRLSSEIKFSDEAKKKLKSVVSHYIKNNKALFNAKMDTAKKKHYSKENMVDIIYELIIFYTHGNISRQDATFNQVSYEEKIKILHTFLEDIIPVTLGSQMKKDLGIMHHIAPLEVTASIVNNNRNIDAIMEKRRKEFDRLSQDISNVLNRSLSSKQYKMKVEKVEYKDIEIDDQYIEKTEKQLIKVSLKDESGRPHSISVKVPKLRPDGSYLINGIPRILINQAILKPITVTEPYKCRFQTLNTTVIFTTKNVQKIPWYEIYIGGLKLPLFNLMCLFANTPDEIMKMYGMEYKLVEAKEYSKNKDTIKFAMKFNDGKVLIFKDMKSAETITMFNTMNIFKPKEFSSVDFFNKDAHEKMIVNKLKNRKAVLFIKKQVSEMLDSITIELLQMEKQPTKFIEICHYITKLIKDPTYTNRIDFRNIRIRSNEVITQLLNFELNKAYTEYQAQLISGNKDAKINIDSDKFFRKIVQLQSMVASEKINPVEELAMNGRMTLVGIGALPNSDSVSNSMRNLHPTGIGIVDPVDTPESGMIGVIQGLAMGAQTTSGRGHVSILDEKEIDKAPSSVLSTSTAMIPYVGHNEGARCIMEASQIRQAIAPIMKEPPLVQTGFESTLVNNLSEDFVKRSPIDGIIELATEKEIIISPKQGGQKIKISLDSVQLRGGGGLNSESIFDPTVKKGQKVKRGDIIAEGTGISNGQISLGRNLLVAFMPYEGYTFEDGIVISEDIAETYGSRHVNTIEMLIPSGSKILECSKVGDKIDIGDPLLSFIPKTIEQVLSYEENQIFKNKIMLKNQHEDSVIRDIEIYPNVDLKDYPILYSIFNTSPGCKSINKHNIGKFFYEQEQFDGILIRFKVSYVSKVMVGSKFTGRYGNKGICGLILPREQMPKTPWGEHVDIILQPYGSVSRMNLGQVYELHTGMIAKALSKLIVEKSRSEALNMIRQVYTVLDKSPDKKIVNDVVGYIKKLNEHAYAEFKDKIKKFGMSIIVPPFKNPSYTDIKEAMDMLGLKFKYKLHIPKYGKETAFPVTVGYMYIIRLEHLPEKKLNARSTHSYSQKTGQPFGGKRRQGGQRVGENELHILASYNANNLIKELFSSSSDDAKAKQEMQFDIINNGHTNLKEVESTPTRDLIQAYFDGLLIKI